MQAFNKIGLFVSQGGNSDQLGDWLTALDEAGIPFFITIAADVAALQRAQEVARQSDVAHTIVYRTVAPGGEQRHTVPAYGEHPAAAASVHWAAAKALLPAEWDAELTWLETIQGVRPDAATADWLGQFGVAMGQIALGEGVKWAAFGYDTAAPEPHAWEQAGMLAYLRLCADHPNQLGIAVHELSQKRDDIWFMRGDHIGRFRKLFAACDRHNIPQPAVLITEWGWTEFRLPSDRDEAILQLGEAAALYAEYPQVRGAALWRLGPGRADIFGQVAPLLPDLQSYTLATRFEVADETAAFPAAPPMSAATPGVAAMGEPLEQPNGRFIADVTIPDDSKMDVGNRFTKIWRVKNTGNTQWGPGYKLVHIDGAQMAAVNSIDLPLTNPGQLTQISLDLTAPDTPGTYFTDWRFQDADGELFGDILFTRIIAEPEPEPTDAASDARFVADVTIPDDTQIEAGKTFTKRWRVKNTGARTWGDGFTLKFVGGTAMTAVTSIPVPATRPNQAAELSLQLTAPAAPGSYFGDWRLHDPEGRPFGDVVYLRIAVPSPVGATLVAPMSQNDPLWKNKRLGHAGSPQTIGEWGCLMTCFAMVAVALGETNPSQFNDAMLSRGGFINGYFTKWNAATEVYSNIIYGGKYAGSHAGLEGMIDASLAAGRPVTVQVDFTRNTPYSDNDQHWVLIVAKDGDDYRINDPWLYPPQEASLKERYGRSGQSARQAIMSAIFYRTAQQPVTPVDPVETPTPAPRLLQTGMNLNPDAPHSNPMDDDTLKGIDWVRYVFKLDARVRPAERGNINIAFDQYDEIVRAYHRMGTKSLIIINQETIWGLAPWQGNGRWPEYADQIANTARRIAQRYRRYGADVAYQIWNEGDKRNNPASVYLEPQQMAIITQAVAAAIRAESPQSPLLFNGMATGPEDSVTYIKQVQGALGGPLPVDAVGIHPYTRWATQAPFDWGQQYGTLGQAFDVLKRGLPGLKFWITEIGVADDNEIGPQWYSEIAAYYKDVYRHVAERHVDLVPVVIWFAWSDWMRNAGIVNKSGARKDHLYAAFRTVRNRELFA